MQHTTQGHAKLLDTLCLTPHIFFLHIFQGQDGYSKRPSGHAWYLELLTPDTVGCCHWSTRTTTQNKAQLSSYFACHWHVTDQGGNVQGNTVADTRNTAGYDTPP